MPPIIFPPNSPLTAASPQTTHVIITKANWSDVATLSGGGTIEAGTALTNLQTMQPSDVWGSAVGGDVHVLADRGSPQPFNLVSMLFSNASSAATWQVRAGATSVVGDFDSGTMTFWASPNLESWTYRHSVLFIVGGITHRWVRVDVDDPTNPAGFLRAGRLYIANAWQPTANFQWGHALGFDDESTRTKTPGGQTLVSRVPPIPAMEFVLGFLSEEEMLSNAYELDRLQGASRDVLVIGDPTSSDHLHKKMVYGLLEPGARIVGRALRVFERRYSVGGLL